MNWMRGFVFMAMPPGTASSDMNGFVANSLLPDHDTNFCTRFKGRRSDVLELLTSWRMKEYGLVEWTEVFALFPMMQIIWSGMTQSRSRKRKM